MRLGRSATDPAGDRLRKSLVPVGAGGQPEFFTTQRQPLISQPDADFFQGLETIGDERRAEYREPTNPLVGELGEQFVGKGLNPGSGPHSRLKR